MWHVSGLRPTRSLLAVLNSQHCLFNVPKSEKLLLSAHNSRYACDYKKKENDFSECVHVCACLTRVRVEETSRLHSSVNINKHRRKLFYARADLQEQVIYN